VGREHLETPIDIDLTNPYSTGASQVVWRWLKAKDPAHRHPPSDLPGFWILTSTTTCVRFMTERAKCEPVVLAKNPYWFHEPVGPIVQ
jgi:hypothetical protein